MLTDLVQQAGVVGAGGAGFPTHVKLNAKAEYFIINAAECEPLIETDKFICRQFAEKVVDGAVEIGKHLEAKHIVIALKGKYKKEIAALKKVIDEKGAKVEIFEMGSYYPAGDEQVMVEQVTGRSVPERGIPLAVGAVVDNVGTVMNVYDALEKFKSQRMKSAIVTDEFGGMVGIVTLKDILEALVGAMPEENEANSWMVREDGSVLADGQFSFYDFLAEYDKEHLYQDNDYNTISGLMIALLKEIPHVGQKVEWDDFTFEIMDMDGARVDKILITLKKGE